MHAPGHSRGNCVFLDRQGGALFEAETILGGATGEPGKLAVPSYYEVVAYRHTMRHLAELPWKTLYSSHSQPRDRQAGLAYIQESLDFVDLFLGQVEKALSSYHRPATFAEICQGMHDQFGYAMDLGLVLMVDTHLNHLARTKRAGEACEVRWSALPADSK